MSIATALLDRPTGPTRPAHVLLVEDTEPVRRAMTAALRAAGFGVTAVPGGAEALAVFDAVRPDVVVTDLTMPGMDGIELVRTLRVREVRVPVLVVSARDGVTGRVPAFDAGADAFLAKPFRLADLLGCVSELARPAVTLPA